MIKLWLSAICGLMITGTVVAQAPLEVMTFNIRLNTPKDSLNAWPHRKEYVAAEILFHHAGIVGVQEALYDQMQDLQQRLPQYKYIGIGREDGRTKGEFSAIFYDTTRLQLLKNETFWLSETPAVPGSIGWDAAITRIVTWGQFKDKKSNKIFYHFNTHFDHMGKIARRESAKFLLQQVHQIAGKTPAVITGDFNATPDDEPIQVVMDPNNPLHFTDSKAISQTPHYGPEGTFNGWHIAETSNQPIDYIFLKGNFRVRKHASISQTWGGRYASDHFAVYSELQFQAAVMP
ncbi:endonuclease/exonuclease/phosphatase family protein [Chitinophaga nivalis]|uniref:Endonuclease/exonuclease/phosphatase family protein n=1 Tax=Chitinophaga nivalis TaxID=2991709 RepID=A0ABT3IWQ4_9BACT|nr:endonuclease/exonuclease/phosphatase family protein [Chitinophaga nivalis]MCW3461893.1 endonuclease/exonuclease/phosphatase family protein [Chitinophaga nivalis]MCW3488416.1 endonuclease/exonuclease/phosphatase family protein [Chitinophaga nivalis]